MAKKDKEQKKKKEQDKHPAEPVEITRHEEKLFSYTFRKTGKPILSETMIEDDKFLWSIKAKTQLTQLHNLFIDAMMTLGFKNNAFATTYDTVVAKLTNTPAFVCVVTLKELKNYLSKKMSMHSFQEIQRISEELTKSCPIELTLIDKYTREVKLKSSTQLVLECGYLSDDLEVVKATLPESERIFKFVQENKVDLEKINKVAKPKETGNLFIMLSPVYVAMLFASKVRVNYSTVILEKFKSIPDGLLLSVIKYITSQKAPYSVKVDTVVEKIIQGEIDDSSTSSIITQFRKKLASGKFNKYLSKFKIAYDREKDMFIYPENIKGIGFSEPFKDRKKKLLKAITKGVESHLPRPKGQSLSSVGDKP